ncbi:type II toxin-antitoxin system ParD family antitoxin [Pseudomonas sp. 25 R 14]|uniref:ribbon-helix-helix domain-containing protein n=1 Tax=Pseudomonas sp. 25 R 14 TaxID=1844109 RepID=UPI001EFBA2AF|nr:type II toxin-antitoxin system ParD family antitoxin [Pseudomonas sp. 25 R 14]
MTDQQGGEIKAQIEAGHGTNNSEYDRGLIRREQERGVEVKGICAALLIAEASGKPHPCDPDVFKQRILNSQS